MAESLFNLSELEAALAALKQMGGMLTEDISLISHTHGRERRGERNIQRVELQRAIKYGTKERANPGRDKSARWRYQYDGVVYITDESSRHEVTSWRVDGRDAEDAIAPAEVELEGRGTHAVLIIDMSGSMRTKDVDGFPTRADAVFSCLCKDFVEAQVKSGAANDTVVTVLLMHDDAHVALNKEPLDANFVQKLKKVGRKAPRSHGNYLPALDRALELLVEDAPNRASVLLVLFSDGAPSDHSLRECPCGIMPYSFDRKEDPMMGHSSKAKAYKCCAAIQTSVKEDCMERIKEVGRVFGRDKAVVATVGFGPPNEDFIVLQEMAAVLPRGSFQKLGLNAKGLRTAFSSLSSSMTELRTEGGSRGLTLRKDKVVNKQQRVEVSDMVHGRDGWWIYSGQEVESKYAFDLEQQKLVQVPLIQGSTGLAFYAEPFQEGVERLVYRCTEIEVPRAKRREWYLDPWEEYDKNGMQAHRRGLRLVCKEPKDEENLRQGLAFHANFIRIQTEAAALAEQFNRRVRGPRHWNVSFLPVNLYKCLDESYASSDGVAWVLVEPELEGKFTKWNNNAGAVLQSSQANAGASSGGMRDLSLGILEEEEDEEEEEIDVLDVPQAFSHFTYEASHGKKLVCDIQGTWNSDDGFVLTDPVVHYISTRDPDKKHKNGATDKGRAGARRFFETHQCNALCERLRLQQPSDELMCVPVREDLAKKPSPSKSAKKKEPARN